MMNFFHLIGLRLHIIRLDLEIFKPAIIYNLENLQRDSIKCRQSTTEEKKTI